MATLKELHDATMQLLNDEEARRKEACTRLMRQFVAEVDARGCYERLEAIAGLNPYAIHATRPYFWEQLAKAKSASD